ncbi:hypothetical protein ACFYMW_34510 [Streptomyces sp. NPDC006692]|uniref:hypothetical protein n=1 Tax=unclassified Streptomyces TaxID=2593676 RepID=UPI0036B48733
MCSSRFHAVGQIAQGVDGIVPALVVANVAPGNPHRVEPGDQGGQLLGGQQLDGQPVHGEAGQPLRVPVGVSRRSTWSRS